MAALVLTNTEHIET